ncbi:hypothetical protein Tco_1497009, partial [Tanacetum coccineum]
RPEQSTHGGKSLALIGLEAGTTCVTPTTQEALSGAKSVLEGNGPQNILRTCCDHGGARPDTCKESRVRKICLLSIDGWVTRGYLPAKMKRDQQLPPGYPRRMPRHLAMGSQLRLRTVDTEVQGLRNQAMNLETLLEAEVDMKKAAEAKNADLTKELESLRAQFTDLQVSNDQLSQQVSTLQAQVTGEERIKAAFEEFKKYEDERVNSRCAEIDARLDKLSVDFDEELYPHMLTAIAGRRWVIGHGLRLAVMKCAESSEIRRAVANVVSAGLAKALQDLKDLKYPMVDQLEKLREAPIELIMSSLHLESDTGEDAPQWIRDLRPSTSQLKIHVYPEVHNPRDHWAIKEEILLEDVIAANVNRAEKKKKCRVVCHNYGVGSAHHPRSNGVLVSAPIVAPQGLAILLADASTQTEISKGEASPRLLRSMSLPAMYNLDWP